jgi:hypothetical protein
VTPEAQIKASAAYRERAKAKGLVRIEAQVPAEDADLIKALAAALRGDGAEATRAAVQQALNIKPLTAFDIFASDLPDEYFEGIFDRDKEVHTREVDLS